MMVARISSPSDSRLGGDAAVISGIVNAAASIANAACWPSARVGEHGAGMRRVELSRCARLGPNGQDVERERAAPAGDGRASRAPG